MSRIFSIGHSNHDWEHFLALLRAHGATALVDVRSQPYSRRFPHFSRAALQPALARAGIAYVFLGLELGARRADPSCYVDGQVDFECVAATADFLRGLDRLRKGAKEHCIVMMCAEREPLDCHRTVLVARHLHAVGLEVAHILADGSLERHADTERRLLSMTGLPEHDMFRDRAETLAEAYRQRGRRIAFRMDDDAEGEEA